MTNKENNFEKDINVPRKVQINDSLKNQDKNFNEHYAHNKNQITINSKIYNACNGCELWNGHHCTADRSYEFNSEKHRIICDKHMAHQYWRVYHELFYKTQECEELKRKVELMMDCPDCKVDEYKKALEEIEKATKINCEEICGRKFEIVMIHLVFQQNFSTSSTKQRRRVNEKNCKMQSLW